MYSFPREDFDFARFDHVADGVNQLESFILQEIGGGGGEQQHGKAEMTIRDNVHITVQAGAVPTVNPSIHEFFLSLASRLV